MRKLSVAVVLEVLREVDGGHAALPQLPLEAVAVGQGGGEALDWTIQWVSATSSRLKPRLGNCH
jgi:hypothetical protein